MSSVILNQTCIPLKVQCEGFRGIKSQKNNIRNYNPCFHLVEICNRTMMTLNPTHWTFKTKHIKFSCHWNMAFFTKSSQNHSVTYLQSAFLLPEPQCLDDMYHFNRTNTQQNPERSDLQSWIRGLSYLPILFYSFLILSFALSLRKLASFTAVTAELIVNHYPGDKAAVTLS